MLTVPTRRFRTTLLAFLPTLLIFSSCSLLNVGPTSSVTFTLHASREAFSGLEDLYMDVDLMGGYKDSQTISLSEGSQFKIEFDNVPIGANVYVQAQIYQNYKGEKAILYTGKSESKTIEETDNTFAVKLESVYNYIASAQYSCLITKPLFTLSIDAQLQKNNKLDYSSTIGFYYWKSEKLSNYQKAKITYRKAGGTDSESNITICLFNSQTNATIASSSETVSVSAESSFYEFLLPEQDPNDSDTIYDSIRIEHTAVTTDDFICAIESIELQTIGSFELVDITLPSSPAFEVQVTKGTTESSATPLTTSGVVEINSSMKIFFAVVNPEPHASTKYTWKKNTVEVKSGFGSDNSKFSITMSELTSGEINDITLFVDDDTFHESWTIQIKRTES